MKLFRWRRRKEEELDAEIQNYLDEAIRDRMERGETAEQARANALIEFGSVGLVKEVTREMWGWALLERLGQDLRFGLRMLWKDKGFTAIALLSLALGIGANTAIFSVIDALMLKTLPVNHPEQLVMVWARDDSPARPDYTFYHPMFAKFRDLSQVFSGVSAIGILNRSNLTINGPGGGPYPEEVAVGMASGNYFSVLGVTPMIGRLFTADDDRVPGGHPVAVLSYDYWTHRFAAAPDVVGRTFTLNNTTYTILGVTPRGFSGDWVGRPLIYGFLS